jgi:hypothetical protein
MSREGFTGAGHEFGSKADGATVAKVVQVCDRIAAIRIRHIMELILDIKVPNKSEAHRTKRYPPFNMMYDNSHN